MLRSTLRYFVICVAVLAATAPAPAQPCVVNWVDRTASPPASGGYAAAFDEVRGLTVMYSGYYRKTWTWNGTGWRIINDDGPPQRNWGHRMVYDSLRGVMVLFGGTDATNDAHRTWEWDGVSWQMRAETGPSKRENHAMTYDSARGVTVLHGGRIPYAGFSAETWEWNGTDWSLRSTTGPAERYVHGMVYDPTRGVCVMYGGRNNSGPLYDTWEWDGQTWTQRAATGPSSPSALLYDPTRGAVVTLADASSGQGESLFRWSGTSWVEEPIAGDAPGGGILIYDRVRDVIVRPANATWESGDGTTWARLVDPDPPASGNMTYDSVRGVVVLLTDGQTWERTGTSWELRDSAGPQGTICFHGGSGETVLLTRAGETWTWDGVSWTLRSTSGPFQRNGHAMAYDSARDVCVLFGGWNGSTPTYGDTWEWDGSTWTLRSTNGPARTYFSMAYDSARGATVLFGGLVWSGISANDTWEWDGTSWTQVAAGGPPARTYHTMTFDSSRGVTVLFGGIDGVNAYDPDFGDTWEWDGNSWTKLLIPGPLPRRAHGLVYDSVRGVTVFFKGDTWELGPVLGDFNCDGDVDLEDYLALHNCLTGPAGGVGAGCDRFDFDASETVDLKDVARFQEVFTGPSP